MAPPWQVEECSATIKSIELQLVRVETCGYQDGTAREATEIQNIQIADGPVCHGWPIPVHMIFPRLFTCPTVRAPRARSLARSHLFSVAHRASVSPACGRSPP